MSETEIEQTETVETAPEVEENETALAATDSVDDPAEGERRGPLLPPADSGQLPSRCSKAVKQRGRER
jgi:hypothetical protein